MSSYSLRALAGSFLYAALNLSYLRRFSGVASTELLTPPFFPGALWLRGKMPNMVVSCIRFCTASWVLSGSFSNTCACTRYARCMRVATAVALLRVSSKSRTGSIFSPPSSTVLKNRRALSTRLSVVVNAYRKGIPLFSIHALPLSTKFWNSTGVSSRMLATPAVRGSMYVFLL